jgi:beta-galactosidase
MPTGRQLFCGVPFDVINPHVNNGKSVITLSGSQILNMPERISNIAVGRKASRLYFLHSASWANSSVELGVYRIKFSNGEVIEIPIQNALNTGDWWFPPTETEASQVVPVPTFNSAVAAFRVKYLRIFEWINPNPQLQIDSIDFVSSNKNAVPILIAVSGVSNSD